VFFAEAPGLSQAYRLQFLAARQAVGGFPVLIGATNPPTDAAFLLRDLDTPGGAALASNFTLGMQTGEFCLDLHLTPSTPGGSLVGTMDVRPQTETGCGDLLVAGRSTAVVPSGDDGSAGNGCAYELLSEADCLEALAGQDTICLRCVDSCPDFENPIVFVETGAGYADCGAISIQRVEGATCGQDCDGVRGMVVLSLEG